MVELLVEQLHITVWTDGLRGKTWIPGETLPVEIDGESETAVYDQVCAALKQCGYDGVKLICRATHVHARDGFCNHSDGCATRWFDRDGNGDQSKTGAG